MPTTEDAIQLRADLAVLTTFRSLGVPPSGELPIERIREGWHTYGLRSADLAPAIDRLVRDKRLRFDGLDHVQLTETGAGWLAKVPSEIEYRLVLKRRSQARSDRKSPFAGRFDRRRGDTITQFWAVA